MKDARKDAGKFQLSVCNKTQQKWVDFIDKRVKDIKFETLEINNGILSEHADQACRPLLKSLKERSQKHVLSDISEQSDFLQIVESRIIDKIKKYDRSQQVSASKLVDLQAKPPGTKYNKY